MYLVQENQREQDNEKRVTDLQQGSHRCIFFLDGQPIEQVSAGSENEIQDDHPDHRPTISELSPVLTRIEHPENCRNQDAVRQTQERESSREIHFPEQCLHQDVLCAPTRGRDQSIYPPRHRRCLAICRLKRNSGVRVEVFGFYREAVIDLSPGFQPWVSRTKRYALKVASEGCTFGVRVGSVSGVTSGATFRAQSLLMPTQG